MVIVEESKYFYYCPLAMVNSMLYITFGHALKSHLVRRIPRPNSFRDTHLGAGSS